MRLIDEANVGLAPGTAFGAGGEHFVRLCFARNPEQLEAAVGRIASVISNRVITRFPDRGARAASVLQLEGARSTLT